MLPLQGHTAAITALAFAPDGEHLASASRDGSVRVWSFIQEVRNYAVPKSVPSALLFERPEKLWIGCENGDSFAQNLESDTLAPHTQTPKMSAGVMGIRILSDEQTMVFAHGSRKGAIYGMLRFVRADGKPTPAMHPEPTGILCLTDRPSTRHLAWSNANREVIVRELTKIDPLVIRLKHNANTISLPPTGERIAVGDDWDIRVFEWKHKSQTMHLRGHKGPVTGLGYTPNGRLLISSSTDKTIRLWDAESGSEMGVLSFPVNRITTMTIAADGLRAAVGDDQGIVLLWDLDAM